MKILNHVEHSMKTKQKGKENNRNPSSTKLSGFINHPKDTFNPKMKCALKLLINQSIDRIKDPPKKKEEKEKEEEPASFYG